MPLNLEEFNTTKKKIEAYKQSGAAQSYDFKIKGQQKRSAQITCLMDELLETMPVKMRSVLRSDHSLPDSRLIIISQNSVSGQGEIKGISFSGQKSKPSETPTQLPSAKMAKISDEAKMSLEHSKTPVQHAQDLHAAISEAKKRQRLQKNASQQKSKTSQSKSNKTDTHELFNTFQEFEEAIVDVSCDGALLETLCAEETLLRLKYQKQIQTTNAKFNRVVATVQYLNTICTMMIKRIQNSYESQTKTDALKEATEVKKLHVAKAELVEYIIHVLPRDETVISLRSSNEAGEIKRPHHHLVSPHGYFAKYHYPVDQPIQRVPYEPGEKLPVCHPAECSLVRNSVCSFTGVLIRDVSRATIFLVRDLEREFPTIGQQTAANSGHSHVKMFISYPVAPILVYMQLLARCVNHFREIAMETLEEVDIGGDFQTARENLKKKYLENEMIGDYLRDVVSVIFEKLLPMAERVLTNVEPNGDDLVPNSGDIKN